MSDDELLECAIAKLNEQGAEVDRLRAELAKVTAERDKWRQVAAGRGQAHVEALRDRDKWRALADGLAVRLRGWVELHPISPEAHRFDCPDCAAVGAYERAIRRAAAEADADRAKGET
jgi:hypothetical protein